MLPTHRVQNRVERIRATIRALKGTHVNPRVATHLMFSGSAAAAMELYGSVFPGFRVERIEPFARMADREFADLRNIELLNLYG